MKLYSKRNFILGLALLAFAAVYALWSLKGPGHWGVSSSAACVHLALIGGCLLHQSLNKKAARAAAIAAGDEMLQLERLKTYRTAFWGSYGVLLLIMLFSAQVNPDLSFHMLLVLYLQLIIFYLIHIVKEGVNT